MATRGPKENNRYARIPARAAIYAVEFRNGIVKVGRTVSARSRIPALAAEAARIYQCELTQYHVGPPIDVDALYHAEVMALSRVRPYASAVPGRSEYFRGLNFDIACLAVDIASAKFAPTNSRACHGADAPFFVRR